MCVFEVSTEKAVLPACLCSLVSIPSGATKNTDLQMGHSASHTRPRQLHGPQIVPIGTNQSSNILQNILNKLGRASVSWNICPLILGITPAMPLRENRIILGKVDHASAHMSSL